MNARKRWQRALMISVILNVFLLGGVGLLSAGIFLVEPVEQFIELELVNEQSPQETTNNMLQSATSSGATGSILPHSASLSVSSVRSSPSVAIQPVPALAVDEVSTEGTSGTAKEEAQEQSSSATGSVNGGSVNGGQGKNGTSRGGQGSGSVSGSGGILRPQILSQVQPSYPESARQAGTTGTVLLKVEIMENGRTGTISVKNSSGNELLDESAMTAVSQWRFTPAKEKNTGRAVGCYTTVPVVFRLN